MEVTTFIDADNASLIADPEAWQSKVTELGLEGQRELYGPDKKANPFLRMDAGLIRVFEALCPSKIEIGKFNIEPIPLQALGMYGLALHEAYFGKVEIWYSPGQPDPVMVGSVGSEKYLMAQWGPEKLSLDECRERAMVAWKERQRARLQRDIADTNMKLSGLENLTVLHFAGEYTGLY
jgi:hypothetical protein